MIDLHCHILCALDDGAIDLEDSIAMARQAQADGIATVCATPHVRVDHDVRVEQIAVRARALQSSLDELGIAVRVLPGAEVAETEADSLSDARLREACLGSGARWLLLEPAPGPIGDALQALVGRLRQRRIDVVLAHPERHAGADFRERLGALARDGCVIQWTAQFIADCDPRGPIMALAREGLVHVLGSDAHSSHGGRQLRLEHGFAALAAVRTPDQMAWSIERAPLAIVRGEPLEGAP